MRKRRSLAVLFLFLSVYVPAYAIDVDNPPVGVFIDEWYATLFNGQKSGHMHTTMERIKRSGTSHRDPHHSDLIRTMTAMTLEVGRAGVQIKIRVAQETTETLDGRPISFRNRTQLGTLPSPSVTEGEIRNGKVTVTSSQFGQQSAKTTYDLPEKAMMSWAVYREQIKRGLKPGTRYVLSGYDPGISPSRITPMSVEILNREMIDLFGRKVEAIKTQQTITLQNMFGQETKMDTLTWLTDAGEAVRVEMTMLNIPIQILACTKSIALSPNDPAEVMVESLIPVARPIDRNARKITYLLTLKKASDSDRLPQLPETRIQEIEQQDRHSAKFSVTRQPLRKTSDKRHMLSRDERKRCLTASAMLNYTDPVVTQLAKQAAGRERDPWKLADRLVRFVADYVQGDSLGVGFASAGEVARSKQGDCTEHGILLAALGRAVGIPTRVVTGVLYIDSFAGRSNVFVGHLWTQFWIDGQWVDLDSAWGQTAVDATHIAMSISDTADSGFADLISSVWLNLGRLRITVLNSE